jgi:hypothetical protein
MLRRKKLGVQVVRKKMEHPNVRRCGEQPTLELSILPQFKPESVVL